jgi:DNA-binding transcriptional MocR family regulator
VLKGEDIVVLLKLVAEPPEWTVRSLSDEVGIPRSVVHRALRRLVDAGLLDQRRRRVNTSQAEELLVHGVKYFFPPALGGETRGVPTAWAAGALADRLAPPTDLPPVWPDPMGKVRGIALEPLHESAPGIARRDPKLAERLALVDALRLGDARVRGLAADLLREQLGIAAEWE